MPTGRINVGVAVVNDVFYIIGGATLMIGNNLFASAVNEQYTPMGFFGSIDTTAPCVEVLSPENKTYYTTDVSLSFVVDEAVSRLRYRIDAQDSITVEGNTTLTNLSYGMHNLTVYATDMSGNTGASETIRFTIAKEPDSTWIIAAVALTVAVLSAGLLVYFLKINKA